MIILLVGGSKSGKSMAAQRYAKKLEKREGHLYYIATMKPYDEEDLKRIKNHVEDRKGWGFTTIEKSQDIKDILDKIDNNDTTLIDSITSLVTNEMFPKDAFISEISDKIIGEINSISNNVKNLVIVTDYLFSDGIIYDDYTNAFRRELGNINISLASIADIVIEFSFGNEIIHKGKNYVRDLNEKFI
ncbi:bifunctional adenosylcobinamide kinase/adenosylcobinamide-phosphate guanylyltransferase [Clostridium nigeriense]|uniref:bifunctional adenosylcobinamide kinase/adenosylcobinamide-phosphate guanylyltransferase n=1 Tax=Clostridium nigeriense TaxID=1805470 RepID=UPI003D341552